MAGTGTGVSVPMQLWGAWPYCNGPASKIVPGTEILAQRQPSRATWQFCSGPMHHMSTAAHGT
eukprot:jgi/Astpho2/9451/gw1.00145.185.1_t